jgi:hypothetical protein
VLRLNLIISRGSVWAAARRAFSLPSVERVSKGPTVRKGERRNLAARAALIQLIINEVMRNPSLILDSDTLRTWLQVPADAAERVLGRLASSGLLREIRKGVWVRGNAIPF